MKVFVGLFLSMAILIVVACNSMGLETIKLQKLEIVCQGQPVANAEVEVLGYGVFGQTNTMGIFALSEFWDRLEQKKVGVPDKISLLIKNSGKIPTTIQAVDKKALLSMIAPHSIPLVQVRIPPYTLPAKASQLRVFGPRVVNQQGQPISEADVFVLNTKLRDQIYDGQIKFVPYIPDDANSFEVVLSKKGYQTQIIKVYIPEHKRGHEAFPMSEQDVVMRPDWFFPIVIKLHKGEPLDSPIDQSNLSFYENPQEIGVLAEVVTKRETHYYAWDNLARATVGADISLGSLELRLKDIETSPLLSGYMRLLDKSKIPNFVLTNESIRNLPIAVESPVQKRAADTIPIGMSFSAKVVIVVLIISAIGIGIVACVFLVNAQRGRTRRKEQEEAKRYKQAGINFWQELETQLNKSKKALKNTRESYLKSRLQEAIALIERLRDKSLEIRQEVDKIIPSVEQLKNQRQQLVAMMKHNTDMKEYNHAKVNMRKIEQVETYLAELRQSQENLQHSLSANNSELRQNLNRLRGIIERINLKQSLTEIERELSGIVTNLGEVLTAEITTGIDAESLVKHSREIRETDDILQAIDTEVSGITEIDIAEMREFLNSHKRRK